MWLQSLGWEDSLEKEMATHSSILAWEIPWTEKPGGLQSMELQSQTILNDWALTPAAWNSAFVFDEILIFPFLAHCGLALKQSQSFLLSTNADGTGYTPASMVASYDKISQV